MLCLFSVSVKVIIALCAVALFTGKW